MRQCVSIEYGDVHECTESVHKVLGGNTHGPHGTGDAGACWRRKQKQARPSDTSERKVEKTGDDNAADEEASGVSASPSASAAEVGVGPARDASTTPAAPHLAKHCVPASRCISVLSYASEVFSRRGFGACCLSSPATLMSVVGAGGRHLAHARDGLLLPA